MHQRFFILGLCSLALLLGGCNKRNIDLKTDEQKFSYVLGQQIGQELKNQGAEVDLDVLKMSILDVMEGKESRLSIEEMKKAMQDMRTKMMDKQKLDAAENTVKAQAFLEENKAKEGVVVTDSGLQYTVLKEGEGAIPTEKDKVKVHYKGTLVDGTEFDSSYTRDQPAEFMLNGVIGGWTEALQLMKVGSKYKLFVPPELGYGSRGRPSIPANSVLIFEVELLEILKPDVKPDKK